MGNITTRQISGAPVPATPETARLAAVMRNRLDPEGVTKNGRDLFSISLPNAPTDAQRGTLARRRGYLADALAPRPSDREPVADAILEMFYAWPDTRRMDAGKAAATAAKYASVVSDLPLWAIERACELLTREDRDFPPSSGTLRAAVSRQCDAARDELVDLQKILTAEVYEPSAHSEEAKRRVREAADAVCAFAPAKPAPRPKDTRLSSRFDDAHKQRDPDAPVAASASLLAAIGKARTA